MMNRNWTDFKSLHSNIAGAREAFENACETLFRKVYYSDSVSQVSVRKGDGGIDIFVGELGVEPITVIQCKFFLESFENSQKAQIRESFDTAANSDKFVLKEWILCIPRVVDIDEHSWWFKWKKKQIDKLEKDLSFISLKNGNELIDLLKEQNLYNKIFQIDDSLKLDEIHNAVVRKKEDIPTNSNPQLVLFNNYSKKCEPFYFEREIDREFLNSLKFSNLWVFGNSGFGKTAMISRNLENNDFEYCFCDLSPITIRSAEDVLREILLQIEEKFHVEHKTTELNLIKNISHTLSANCHKTFVIVVDELSVKDSSVLRLIANDILKLVTYFNNNCDSDQLKFVVSTISSPIDIIENKSKAAEYFQYTNCDTWDVDLENLFQILVVSLNLELSEYKDLIISSCKNSPRILKSIFRKIMGLQATTEEKILLSIKMCISEL